MIKFIADSSIDIHKMPEVNYATVPLTIYTDERSYTDNIDLNMEEMLDYLASYNARSYTSCPSTDAWLQAFEGADEIYAVTLTSALSGTYNSAMIARQMYLAEHPEARILIVDTLSVGPEMYIIMQKMIDWHKEGKSFECIEKEIEEYRKTTRLFFAFQSMHNLAQNGRIPKIAASAIGIMNLTVLGTASEDGHVKPNGKARGEKRVIAGVMKELAAAGFKGGRFFLCHVQNPELAKKIADQVKAVYADAEIRIVPAGGICSFYGERGGIIIGCEC